MGVYGGWGADLSERAVLEGVKDQGVRRTCMSIFRDPDPCVHEWTNSPRGKAKWLGWQNPENRKVGHFELETR